MNATKREIEADGYALVHRCVSGETIRALETALDADQHGIRNLLSNQIVRAIAGSDEVRRPVASVLGQERFAGESSSTRIQKRTGRSPGIRTV